MLEVTPEQLGVMGRMEALPARKPGAHERKMSPLEQEAILKWWGTGRTIADMARAVPVSENVFRRWLRQLGLI